MLSASKDLPAVKAMLDTATKVLGYDILKICLDGAPRFGLAGLVAPP